MKFILVSIVSALFLGPSITVAQEQGAGMLADVHIQKNIQCASCHPNPSDPKEINSEGCQGCHGDLEKMADLSEGKFDVNPHAPHGTTVDCLKCHHGHSAPENYCNKCHDFDFFSKKD